MATSPCGSRNTTRRENLERPRVVRRKGQAGGETNRPQRNVGRRDDHDALVSLIPSRLQFQLCRQWTVAVSHWLHRRFLSYKVSRTPPKKKAVVENLIFEVIKKIYKNTHIRCILLLLVC